MYYRRFNFLRVHPPSRINADFDRNVVVLHRRPGGIGFVLSFEFNHKVNHISNIVTDEFSTELLDKECELLDGRECSGVFRAKDKDPHRIMITKEGISRYSIFEDNHHNGIEESSLTKNILVFVLIISLSKRDNDRNVLLIECIFNIDMKPVRSH